MCKSSITILIPIFMLFHLSCSEPEVSAYQKQGQGPMADGTYYVAPWGDDNDSGTYKSPWATWQKAFITAKAGDIVYFRGGVYRPAENIYGYSLRIAPTVIPNITIEGQNINKGVPMGSGIGHNGTPSEPICYFNYPGETPILDYSDYYPAGHYNTGLNIENGFFLKFRGLTIRNVYQRQRGTVCQGIVATGSNNLSFENCVVHDIGGRGFGFFGGYIPNIFIQGVLVDSTRYLNCDSYNLCDSLCLTSEDPCVSGALGGSADGYKYDNSWDSYVLFKGCRAWNCSDDGFDCGGVREFVSCWAFNIGKLDGDGYGWKNVGLLIRLGPDRATLSLRNVNCIAAFCTKFGFCNTQYQNYQVYYETVAQYYNNISYKNRYGFEVDHNNVLPSRDNYYKNNIAYMCKDFAAQLKDALSDHNSWDASPAITLSDKDFVNLIPSRLSGPRKADGSLPDIDFLHLANGSKLIDAGVPVGLPFNGLAPDLGPFESNP